MKVDFPKLEATRIRAAWLTEYSGIAKRNAEHCVIRPYQWYA